MWFIESVFDNSSNKNYTTFDSVVELILQNDETDELYKLTFKDKTCRYRMYDKDRGEIAGGIISSDKVKKCLRRHRRKINGVFRNKLCKVMKEDGEFRKYLGRPKKCIESKLPKNLIPIDCIEDYIYSTGSLLQLVLDSKNGKNMSVYINNICVYVLLGYIGKFSIVHKYEIQDKSGFNKLIIRCLLLKK